MAKLSVHIKFPSTEPCFSSLQALIINHTYTELFGLPSGERSKKIF